MGLKMNFSNHWLMVRLNLILDHVRNCEKTTTFLKQCKKIIKCKKKWILNFAYKQELLFGKSESDKEIYNENRVSKTRKRVRKTSKTQSGNEFK